MHTDYIKSKEELIKYYQNLIELQYHDREKARAEIRLFVEVFLANMLLWQITELNLNLDEAQGYSADIIGLWVGLDRLFRLYAYDRTKPFFAYPNWHNPVTILQGGYSNWHISRDTDYPFIHYELLELVFDRLGDTDFVNLLKLKIIMNNIIATEKNIDDALYQIFGTELVTQWNNDMTVNYYYGDSLIDISPFIKQKNLLPHPTGVKATLQAKISN
jgi:hypothetical protein